MKYQKEMIISDLHKLGKLIVGFLIMSVGITLNIRAGLGLSSWNIFHNGLENVIPLTFGQIIQIVGLIILVLSVVFLKSKVGPGTILNILLVGFFIDTSKEIISVIPDLLIMRILFLACGILLMTFGRALYISTRLGPGPRDGLFVGLSRVTQIDVKYIKPAIEFTVLVIGYLLGGVFGIGTIITIVISGYLVQFFFTVLGFDSKSTPQRGFGDYILQKDTV